MSTIADTMFGKAVRKESSQLIWLGVALLVVGVAALVFPMISTLVATYFVGWVLVITGLLGLFVAFSIRGAGPFFGGLLFSLLSVGAGAFILARPSLGELAITISLGAVFMAQGAFEAVFAFEIGPSTGRGWMLLSAAASIVLAIVILMGLPALSLVALGTLIGVNFVTSGLAYLFVGGAARRELKKA
jgi:uncharacterized membrane protein HdeD (DUF308 family)